MIAAGKAYPPEIKEKIIQAILNSLEKGSSLMAASTAAQISHVTFWSWRKDDSELEKAVQEIMLSRIAEVEDSVYISATAGDARAQEFFLTNRAPERWKKRHYNTLENPDGTGLMEGLKALPDTEIDRRITEIVTRLGLKSG